MLDYFLIFGYVGSAESLRPALAEQPMGARQ